LFAKDKDSIRDKERKSARNRQQTIPNGTTSSRFLAPADAR
jgi:hypothetical protein